MIHLPPINWQSRRIKDSRPHQNISFKIGLNNLNILERNEKIITLSGNHKFVEFMSCSYLGLECDPRLSMAAKRAIDKYGVQVATARTRLKPVLFDQLDDQLGKIFQGPTLTYATVDGSNGGGAWTTNSNPGRLS